MIKKSLEEQKMRRISITQITLISVNCLWRKDNNRDSLREHIRKNGLLEPVVVTKSNKGFIILSGYPRYQCLVELGRKTIK